MPPPPLAAGAPKPVECVPVVRLEAESTLEGPARLGCPLELEIAPAHASVEQMRIASRWEPFWNATSASS